MIGLQLASLEDGLEVGSTQRNSIFKAGLLCGMHVKVAEAS